MKKSENFHSLSIRSLFHEYSWVIEREQHTEHQVTIKKCNTIIAALPNKYSIGINMDINITFAKRILEYTV